MGLFKIFNKGVETSGTYTSKQKAEKEIEKAVKRSKKYDEFEPQKKKDYKIKKIKD